MEMGFNVLVNPFEENCFKIVVERLCDQNIEH